MDWKLLSSKLVYNKFMQVENRVYELPNGIIKDYDIKLGKPSVCVLAVTADNKILICEEYRPGPGKVLRELPGGMIDTKDDETPEAAAARELLEETGYTGELEFVTQYQVDAYTAVDRYAFVATNCEETGKQHLDDSEDIKVKLLDLPDFIRLVRSGQLTDVEVAFLGLDHLGLLEHASPKHQ
jgi:ADP-ribose pyrophosphatase